LDQGKKHPFVVTNEAEHCAAAGADHVTSLGLARTAVVQGPSGELVCCFADRAVTALGFRAGTEGLVFVLIADFPRA